MDYQVEINGKKVLVEINGEMILLNGEKYPLKFDKKGDKYLIYNEKRITQIRVLSKEDDCLTLEVNGKGVTVGTKNQLDLMLDKLGMTATASQVQSEIIAPMPGVILEIKAKTGSHVKKGEPLLILEAMKMENMIKAPTDVLIKSIDVSAGQSIEKNQVLVTFE